MKLPSDPAQLKRAYEATQPAADGLFRTLYAEALVCKRSAGRSEKIDHALASTRFGGRCGAAIHRVSQIHGTSPYSGFMSFFAPAQYPSELSRSPRRRHSSTIQKELAAAGFGDHLKPGASIAIGVGSRGIANIAEIVRAVVGLLEVPWIRTVFYSPQWAAMEPPPRRGKPTS